MDGNAGVAHEGGIGVAAACSQKWKSHQVQVCPRHTDVPACTHTYTHTYVHVRTYTHKYARTICILYAHTTGIDTWVKISPAIRRHYLMGRCGMGFSTANSTRW